MCEQEREKENEQGRKGERDKEQERRKDGEINTYLPSTSARLITAPPPPPRNTPPLLS